MRREITYNAESMHDARLRGVLHVDQFVAVLVIQPVDVGSNLDRRQSRFVVR